MGEREKGRGRTGAEKKGREKESIYVCERKCEKKRMRMRERERREEETEE